MAPQPEHEQPEHEQPEHQQIVLVGVTPGQPDDVVLQAAQLAKDLSIELVCANVDAARYMVVEHADGSMTSLPFDPDLPSSENEEFDPALADHLAKVLARSDVTWSLRSLAGDPARAIGHLAETLDARLIVVGTRGTGFRGTFHEFFYGSIAVHLAHRQRRPVVVVPLAPQPDGIAPTWTTLEEGSGPSGD
jgi:nucleotide-binding universal stress UspA family protein